jgi:hypothetical protein
MIKTLAQSGALFALHRKEDWLGRQLRIGLRFEQSLLRINLRNQRKLKLRLAWMRIRQFTRL